MTNTNKLPILYLIGLLLLVNINPVAAQTTVILQNHDVFLQGAPTEWYSFIAHQRAYVIYNNSYPEINKIFIDSDALFFGDRDYQLLIAHEMGHINGRDHELFGVMSGIGIVRLLTSGGNEI